MSLSRLIRVGRNAEVPLPRTYEYEMTGATTRGSGVGRSRAAGRTYPLWASLPASDEVGFNLIRLAGWDPPAGDVGRRDHAVTVPTSGEAQVPLPRLLGG
jgi:hypothetical protein